jgi:cytochrome c-type biogenesis protein
MASQQALGVGWATARWRQVLLGSLALLAVVLVVYPSALSGLARAIYGAESGLYRGLAPAVQSLRGQPGLGLLVPLFLGLIGATAPCQLSTGVAAVCFVARDGDRATALPRALAFVVARVVVYLAVGALVIYLLDGSAASAGPAFGWVRRFLGPLSVLVGLVLLRLVRVPWPVVRSGDRESGGSGLASALALGLAYSLAFCPTLFLLFFGITVPLAFTAPLGVLYPAVFALGMSLPLLAVTFSLPAPQSTKALKRGMLSGGRNLTVRAGALMLLVGLLDTIVYWAL